MSDITVTVENVVAAVTVENLAGGPIAVVEAPGDPVTVVISNTGVQGPPGNGGDLDPDFIIDGGNF